MAAMGLDIQELPRVLYCVSASYFSPSKARSQCDNNNERENGTVFWILAIFFAAFLTLLRYPGSSVVMTFATVDRNARMVKTDSAKDESRRAEPCSIASVLKTIHGIQGWRSFWRGLPYAFCYSGQFFILRFALVQLLSTLIVHEASTSWNRVMLAHAISEILAGALLSNWALGWTELVLSPPGSRRILVLWPSKSSFIKAMLPTGLVYFGYVFFVYTSMFALLSLPESYGFPGIGRTYGGLALVDHIVIPAVLPSLVIVAMTPIYAALTMLFASTISNENETVFEFDRTFSGLFTPGSGALTLRQYHKSFVQANLPTGAWWLVKLNAIIWLVEALSIGLCVAAVHAATGLSLTFILQAVAFSARFQSSGRPC